MAGIIACEKSQVICMALRNKGIEAYSCDIDPCYGGYPQYHIQDDILNHLNDGWDFMIAHPPCTHTAVSGAAHFAEKRKDGRQQAAIDFFLKIANANIFYIAIEHPVSIISTYYRKPDQIIQPYQFGHKESKRTCLWLKNLPLLEYTDIVEPDYYKNKHGNIYKDKKGRRYSKTHYYPEKQLKALWNNQTISGQNKLPPSINRADIRSRTYEGIAKAIADQWSKLLT